MSRFRFYPSRRLRHGADYRRVYDRRCSASDGILLMYGLGNGLAYSRMGLSVGRKLGGAVRRNRLKRLLREAFRLSQARLPGGLDLVLVPRRGADPTLEQLLDSIPILAKSLDRKLQRGAKR